MSCRHYFLKSSVLMSLITENTGCASYKTKLQNVEDTSNSWENRRYEFSPALSAKKSSHFTRNGQKFSCVIHGSNFQNVLRTLKSSWKRRYHLSLVPPGKLSSPITHNGENWSCVHKSYTWRKYRRHQNHRETGGMSYLRHFFRS